MVMRKFTQLGDSTKSTRPCCSRLAGRPLARGDRGFTLLELMVVASIIVILAAIAVGRYDRTVIKAHEVVLRADLRDMRKAINDYTLDKEAAPNSLDDLVPNYIREVPKDPMTGQKDWNSSNCDTLLSPDQVAGGLCDVNSSSQKISPFDGTPYSSW
jgi:general secretion pathway protein G